MEIKNYKKALCLSMNSTIYTLPIQNTGNGASAGTYCSVNSRASHELKNVDIFTSSCFNQCIIH